MLSDILPTGLECGVLNGQVKPGDIVAIVGAGPVGLAALLAARSSTRPPRSRALRSGQRLGNSARLSRLILQAHDERAAALLDQIAEPLRVAARADALVRGPAGHPSGVPGVTVGITA